MKIILNGEPHNHKGLGTLDSLLDEVGANKNHTALMLNGAITPKEKWRQKKIHENDQIEMLVFVGGG